MKLYLAIEASSDLMSGYSEIIVGVFSTEEKALNVLKQIAQFEKYEEFQHNLWKHVFDGELTEFLEIREVELDKVRF